MALKLTPDIGMNLIMYTFLLALLFMFLLFYTVSIYYLHVLKNKNNKAPVLDMLMVSVTFYSHASVCLVTLSIEDSLILAKYSKLKKVVKETLIVSQPSVAPSPYPGQPTQPTSTLVTTPSGIVTSQPILPAAVPVKTTTTNRIVGGGKKKYNKKKIKKTNKLNI